jgi:hypothetical protein
VCCLRDKIRFRDKISVVLPWQKSHNPVLRSRAFRPEKINSCNPLDSDQRLGLFSYWVEWVKYHLLPEIANNLMPRIITNYTEYVFGNTHPICLFLFYWISSNTHLRNVSFELLNVVNNRSRLWLWITHIDIIRSHKLSVTEMRANPCIFFPNDSHRSSIWSDGVILSPEVTQNAGCWKIEFRQLSNIFINGRPRYIK